MTLKNRNRMILALLWLSIGFLILNSLILAHSIKTQVLPFSMLYNTERTGFFIFKIQQLYIVIGIFLQLMFAIVGTYVTYRSFVNTQSSEVLFFALFIFAGLLDSFRLWIPAFNLQNTYSPLFLFCGNASLVSTLLTPASLLIMCTHSFNEQKQDTEKLVAIVIFIAIFTAVFIPLNTTKNLFNFTVAYSFKKIIVTYTIICYGLTLLINFLYNKQRTYDQKTTFGLLFLMIGYHAVRHSVNIAMIIVATLFLTMGSVFFIKELHNQYLWTD